MRARGRREITREPQCFEQRGALAVGQITAFPNRQPGNAERAEPDPTERFHRDADGVHQPADRVVHPLVDDDFEEDPLAGFPQDAELVRDNPPTVDHHAIAHAPGGAFAGTSQGDDVVFLGEFVSGVHHPMGHVAVVRQQQEPFGVSIETADRIEPLSGGDEVHHGAATSLVLGGGDVSRGFVEQNVAECLPSEGFAVDGNDAGGGVDFGAEFGHDTTVDRHATGPDHRLRPAAGGDAPGGEDPLQPFLGFDGILLGTID